MTGTQEDTERSTAYETDRDISPGAREMLSRRRFMKTSAAASAGALALGSGASSVSAQTHAKEECEEGMLEIGNGDWMLFDNQWGMPGADMCIWENEDGTFGYDFDATSPGECNDFCINYPEAFCGTRPWGTDTGIPELAGPRGDIDELILEWDVDVNIWQGEWDLAEEWWLMNGEPGEDPDLQYEIMLVLDWGGGHDHGAPERAGAINDQFGNTIDHWTTYGTGGTDATFYIFRISGGASSGKVDLTEIRDYISQQEGLGGDMTMTAVEVGNEYWDGAQGDVTYNNLTLHVNGSTYAVGSDVEDELQPPAAPSNLGTSSVTSSSATVSWDPVEDAAEYEVYLEDSSEGTTSSTSMELDGLSADTFYSVDVEAINEAGRSNPAGTSFQTEEEPQDDNCTTVDGQTVCDVDGDGHYRDVTGDGSVGQTDVVNFFEVQHRSAWKQPSMFDFSGNGSVGHGDVVELFEYVATQ